MKYCPNCNCLLPNDAHFCLKCMYEYPKSEIVFEREERKKKKKVHLIIINIIVVCILCTSVFTYTIIQIKKKIADYRAEQAAEKEAWIQRMFRTGEDIPYNGDIKYDFRDNLTGLEELQQKLGEETEEVYEDDGFMVHTFGIVTAYLNENNVISCIYIDYTVADRQMRKEYGVYGFNGESTKEQMLEEFEIPDQNLGEEEYYFRFDGLEGAPSLCAIWDENGDITALQYYRILF